jgi:syntaxin 6
MSSGVRDPFYSVKDKVQLLLQQLTADIPQWSALAVTSPDWQQQTQQIKSKLKSTMIDLNDLSQTIAIVETNRSRFTSISDRELDSRRTFVAETRTQCQQWAELVKDRQKQYVRHQATINQQSSNSSSNATTATGARSTAKYSGASAAAAADAQSRAAASSSTNDEFVNRSQTTHQSLVAQQDDVLVDMSDALSRLQNLSEDINKDLYEHKEMLDEMDAELDEAQGNMGVVLRKLDKLLKSSDKGRICCIFVLLGIALLLLLLIIWT